MAGAMMTGAERISIVTLPASKANDAIFASVTSVSPIKSP